MNINDYPLSLTVKHVAKIMGVSVPKAYDIVRRPDFPKLKDENRILIARDAFWRWYNDQQVVEIAATNDGNGIPPERLQFLMNRSAACLSELMQDLKYNMSEVRVVASLMKGAADLWHMSQGK